VVLLSLIPEKKTRYLVPVLIPLAINTGFYIHYLLLNFSKLKAKKETIPVYFNFGLIAFIAISLPFILYFLLKEVFEQYIISYILTSISVFVIGILIFKNLIRKKIKIVFYLTLLFMVSIFTFGLPISKSFTNNKEYNAINTLHTFEEKHAITTFSIGEITPELLWDYNGYLKNIYKNQTLIIPNTNTFGLLIMNADVNTITSKLQPNFTLQFIETYNLNVGLKKKERLIRQFYLVSKK